MIPSRFLLKANAPFLPPRRCYFTTISLLSFEKYGKLVHASGSSYLSSTWVDTPDRYISFTICTANVGGRTREHAVAILLGPRRLIFNRDLTQVIDQVSARRNRDLITVIVYLTYIRTILAYPQTSFYP